MDMEEYLSKMEAIGNAVDEKNNLHSNIDIAQTLGIDEEVFKNLKELISMAEKNLTEDEITWGKANYLYIERIREASISDNDKIIMGAIYGVANALYKEKKFLRYFESYNEDHPAFKNTNLLKKQRKDELILLEGSKIINDHIFLDGHYFRLPYYKESMVEYLKETKDKYKTFVRIDPYVILDEPPLKVVREAVIRPINPKWIQKLTMYPGEKTAGEYELQEPLEYQTSSNKPSAEEKFAYMEYHELKIRKLDVCAARGNNRNLHMMIEELSEAPVCGKYFIGKCIHLDTDDMVGTPYESSTLNHMDLAINVYDKDTFEKRKEQSLSSGKVIDAKIRTHIMRVEHVSFTHLPQLAADFLDSKTLYLEWMNDMFGGKEAGVSFIRN